MDPFSYSLSHTTTFFNDLVTLPFVNVCFFLRLLNSILSLMVVTLQSMMLLIEKMLVIETKWRVFS